MSDQAPPEVLALAQARSAARAARDWPTADRLRREIEAAGWKVVDDGTAYRLERAHPPDLAESGRTRYGSSGAVPSRLAEPATAPVTVVLLATDWPADLARALAGLDAHAPADTQLLIVADDPSAEQAAALEALPSPKPAGPLEVVWTSARLGHAGALNVGLRRALGEVVMLLDTSVEPTGDCIGPLVAALQDPRVAVAGPWGLTSDDLRHFQDAPAGDVDAIAGYCMAFRRTDAAARGPLDEHFRFYRNFDIWWCLVLRDEGPAAAPRRAVALAELPLLRHEHRGWLSLPDAERDRLSKRNFYRVLDRFGSRRDLLVGSGRTSPAA
ncbi:MAG: glycosyltransferase family 2 protein [Candidatus Limnocylindrales bacterium]